MLIICYSGAMKELDTFWNKENALKDDLEIQEIPTAYSLAVGFCVVWDKYKISLTATSLNKDQKPGDENTLDDLTNDIEFDELNVENFLSAMKSIHFSLRELVLLQTSNNEITWRNIPVSFLCWTRSTSMYIPHFEQVANSLLSCQENIFHFLEMVVMNGGWMFSRCVYGSDMKEKFYPKSTLSEYISSILNFDDKTSLPESADAESVIREICKVYAGSASFVNVTFSEISSYVDMLTTFVLCSINSELDNDSNSERNSSESQFISLMNKEGQGFIDEISPEFIFFARDYVIKCARERPFDPKTAVMSLLKQKWHLTETYKVINGITRLLSHCQTSKWSYWWGEDQPKVYDKSDERLDASSLIQDLISNLEKYRLIRSQLRKCPNDSSLLDTYSFLHHQLICISREVAKNRKPENDDESNRFWQPPKWSDYWENEDAMRSYPEMWALFEEHDDFYDAFHSEYSRLRSSRWNYRYHLKRDEFWWRPFTVGTAAMISDLIAWTAHQWYKWYQKEIDKTGAVINSLTEFLQELHAFIED